MLLRSRRDCSPWGMKKPRSRCRVCGDRVGSSLFPPLFFFSLRNGNNRRSLFCVLLSEGQLCSQSPVSVGTFWLGKDLTSPSPRFFLSLPCQRSPLFIRGWLVGDSPVLCWYFERWKCWLFSLRFLPRNLLLKKKKNHSVYPIPFFSFSRISARPNCIHIVLLKHKTPLFNLPVNVKEHIYFDTLNFFFLHRLCDTLLLPIFM